MTPSPMLNVLQDNPPRVRYRVHFIAVTQMLIQGARKRNAQQSIKTEETRYGRYI